MMHEKTLKNSNETRTQTEPFVRMSDLCNHLSVSRRTVDRLLARGEIPAHRLGSRTIRFRISEVEAAISGRR